MQEIKDFKKSYCAVSVMYIMFGIVLLFWPDLSLRTLCYVLGVMAIIFGLVHIVLYFIKDKVATMLQLDLVSGICGIAAGIFILVKPEFIIGLLPFLAGIVLLLGAVIKLQNALDLKRLEFSKWYFVLIAALAMMALGVLLILNPFSAMDAVVMIMGIGLLLDGAINLFDMFMINHIIKKIRKEVEKNTGIDFFK